MKRERLSALSVSPVAGFVAFAAKTFETFSVEGVGSESSAGSVVDSQVAAHLPTLDGADYAAALLNTDEDDAEALGADDA